MLARSSRFFDQRRGKLRTQAQRKKLRRIFCPELTILFPMKTLVIETSSDSALLALVQDGQVLSSVPLPGGPTLSKTLGLEIKKLLTSYPLPYDQIVLGTGPGSYTGLRVGAAMAQALAFGWNIPLLTACSLFAFAPSSGPFAVALDARLGGLYILPSDGPAQKLPTTEALSFLRRYPLITTPHPHLIQPKLPDLFLVHTHPDPLRLVAEAADRPLELLYL